jgi:hypothetical protein
VQGGQTSLGVPPFFALNLFSTRPSEYKKMLQKFQWTERRKRLRVRILPGLNGGQFFVRQIKMKHVFGMIKRRIHQGPML